VQDGRDVADIAHSLHQQAKGFTHPDVKILQIEGEAKEVPYNRYFPPDTQAAIFWLRNRRRKQWREVIEHEHTISDEKLRELEEEGIRARNGARGGDLSIPPLPPPAPTFTPFPRRLMRSMAPIDQDQLRRHSLGRVPGKRASSTRRSPLDPRSQSLHGAVAWVVRL